jgi:hypothetical protein
VLIVRVLGLVLVLDSASSMAADGTYGTNGTNERHIGPIGPISPIHSPRCKEITPNSANRQPMKRPTPVANAWGGRLTDGGGDAEPSRRRYDRY